MPTEELVVKFWRRLLTLNNSSKKYKATSNTHISHSRIIKSDRRFVYFYSFELTIAFVISFVWMLRVAKSGDESRPAWSWLSFFFFTLIHTLFYDDDDLSFVVVVNLYKKKIRETKNFFFPRILKSLEIYIKRKSF